MIEESEFAALLARRRHGAVWKRHEMTGVNRPVWVCLPASMATQAGLAYPVIYLEGGTEWFGDATHGLAMDAWVDELVGRGRLAESILVATGCDPQAGIADFSPEQGGAGRTEFLVSVLVPAIDAVFPTIRHRRARVLAGTALGALHAIDTVRRHPSVFGGVAGWSTSFEDLSQSPPAACRFLRAWGDSAPQPGGLRIALTYGGRGLDECYEGYHRDFEALLTGGGWRTGRDFSVTRHVSAGHGPEHWRLQIGAPLAFVSGQ